jgi:hypothetical protein
MAVDVFTNKRRTLKDPRVKFFDEERDPIQSKPLAWYRI